jgi:hypothetical protein
MNLVSERKKNERFSFEKKNLLDQNDDGVIFNPVYACCHCGSVECLQLLLEAKAKIDWRTNQGNLICYRVSYLIRKKNPCFFYLYP